MTDVKTIAAPAVSTPARALPKGACDAHSHVFGPFDRHLPLQSSVYALPEGYPEVHARMRATLGVSYGILTQPAPYAHDPSAMLDAIVASAGALRGVAVADASIDDATLDHWATHGIVGLRFTEMRAPGGGRYPGSVGFDQIAELAPRLSERGMHAQLWASAATFAKDLPRLATLGLPLVLDHMASPDAAAGVAGTDFQDILRVVGDNDIWVKLAICRVSAAAPDYADARPFHDAFVAAAPERCLWGSDWPYVRLHPAPDAGKMMDLFFDWTADPGLQHRILVDNPATLYSLGDAR